MQYCVYSLVPPNVPSIAVVSSHNFSANSPYSIVTHRKAMNAKLPPFRFPVCFRKSGDFVPKVWWVVQYLLTKSVGILPGCLRPHLIVDYTSQKEFVCTLLVGRSAYFKPVPIPVPVLSTILQEEFRNTFELRGRYLFWQRRYRRYPDVGVIS